MHARHPSKRSMGFSPARSALVLVGALGLAICFASALPAQGDPASRQGSEEASSVWHKDLAKARKLAKAQRKPILLTFR